MMPTDRAGGDGLSADLLAQLRNPPPRVGRRAGLPLPARVSVCACYFDDLRRMPQAARPPASPVASVAASGPNVVLVASGVCAW